WQQWHPSIRRAQALSTVLFEGWNDALLFRTLATLRLDVPMFAKVEELRWKGPGPDFEETSRRMKAGELLGRAERAKSKSQSE
ncbi:MAG TPA: flap endonuclease, partial [Candidatus Angelobacter sp.]